MSQQAAERLFNENGGIYLGDVIEFKERRERRRNYEKISNSQMALQAVNAKRIVNAAARMSDSGKYGEASWYFDRAEKIYFALSDSYKARLQSKSEDSDMRLKESIYRELGLTSRNASLISKLGERPELIPGIIEEFRKLQGRLVHTSVTAVNLADSKVNVDVAPIIKTKRG